MPERLPINGTLFFVADDGMNGTELWKSDGTPAGTTMVKDINPGSNPSSPGALTNLNGTLFFVAHNAANGRELDSSTSPSTPLANVSTIARRRLPQPRRLGAIGTFSGQRAKRQCSTSTTTW